MLRHLAILTDRGPAVAYMRHDGAAVIVCECPTEQAAQDEAERINRENRALQRMQAMRHRPAYYGRRHVRYFPDEDTDLID